MADSLIRGKLPGFPDQEISNVHDSLFKKMSRRPRMSGGLNIL